MSVPNAILNEAVETYLLISDTSPDRWYILLLASAPGMGTKMMTGWGCIPVEALRKTGSLVFKASSKTKGARQE
jgi:hypothetical protein